MFVWKYQSELDILAVASLYLHCMISSYHIFQGVLSEGYLSIYIQNQSYVYLM